MMAPDRHSSLAEIELFLQLSPEEIRDLESRLPEVAIEGARIFYTPWHKGEQIFLLLEGRVRIYRLRGVREITLSVRYPGELFGEVGLTSPTQNAWAQTLDPARIAIIGRKTLRNLVAEKPVVSAAMIELLTERLSVYEDMIEDISLKEIPARLASLLARCVESEGVAAEEGYVIPHNYTHQFMASMVGCERVALTRAFKELREADLIRVSERRIHVPNLKLLKSYAEQY